MKRNAAKKDDEMMGVEMKETEGCSGGKGGVNGGRRRQRNQPVEGEEVGEGTNFCQEYNFLSLQPSEASVTTALHQQITAT